MPRLPSLSAREVLKALSRAGFEEKRQSGSHIILEHTRSKRPVVVPNHTPIKRGTLRAIIHQSGLTVNEFLDLL